MTAAELWNRLDALAVSKDTSNALLVTADLLRAHGDLPLLMDLLDMPEEEMTIYRADGSYVTIKCLFGEVWLTDSRQSASTHKMSSDRFLSRVI